MISRTIGRHVALVGSSLGRRQGFLVAAGFILGCGFWLVSWYFDYRDGKLANLAADGAAFKLTGAWLRENVATRLIELSSIIAIILAYLQVTGRHFDQLRARYWLRGHIIICGMSSRSQFLARDLAEKGDEVVIIDLAPAEIVASRRREEGICVIHGDATQPDVLLVAGIARAARVVCLTGQDDTNCGIVEACRCLLDAGEHGFAGELNVHCHIQNLRLRSQLARLKLFVCGLVGPDNRYSARFRLFSIEASAAAEVLQRFPPERAVPRERQQDDVHIVLLGSGSIAQAFLLQIAHVCHYWRSPASFEQPVKGVRVSWIAPDAASAWAQLLALVPALPDLIDLQLLSLPLDDAQTLAELEQRFGEHPPTQVYVALPDASSTLSQALLLLERFDAVLAGAGVVAAVFPPQLNPVDIDEWNKDSRLQGYDLYSASSASVIIDEANDSIAREIHDAYFASQKGESFVEGSLADGTAMHAWANLNEWYRNSNRYVAAHFDVKLRAIGWERYSVDKGAVPATIPDQEIESLAEMEHRRWMAFHLLGGWRQGEPRDSSRRIHPSIKPYADLKEPERQKDRNSVLDMTKQLAQAGFGVRPMPKLLSEDFPDTRVAERLPTRSFVEFAVVAGFVETLEGRVACDAGAAIVTGVNGERWPVARERFDRTYEPDQGTQARHPGYYLRRPETVLAYRLKEVTRVELAGGRGELTAGAGDWLVEYSPGDRALIAEDIFAKTYRLLNDRV